jgi:hypothetical protein
VDGQTSMPMLDKSCPDWNVAGVTFDDTYFVFLFSFFFLSRP